MTTRQIQNLLDYLGYDPGAIDGIQGKNTREAVQRFQSREGLSPDGIAGEETEQALLAAVAAGRTEEAPKDAGGPGWWREIRYFKRNEPYIGCSCGRCGGFPAEPSEELMRLADRIRREAGAPMIPSSTIRCPNHNRAVGGVAGSRHLTGRAMDFSIPGWSAQKVLTLVRSHPEVRYAYAINQTHVHMDVP